MRISLLTIGSRGDVQPYVALGMGLRDAGHDVTVATHACWEAFVREHDLGFSPVAGDPRGVLEGQAGQMWLESGRNPLRMTRGLADVARPLLWQASDDFWQACQSADLILFSMLAALPAGAIAHKLGIPAYAAYLQHVHATAAYPCIAMPPMPRLGGVYNRLTHALGAEVYWQAIRSTVSRWRQERLGLAPLPLRNQFGDERLARIPCFYGFSPAVVPKPPDWGDNIHVTGYWFVPSVARPSEFNSTARPAVPAGLVDFLSSGPPPVFVGFGSMTGRDPEWLAECVLSALAMARQRGVLLTGWGGLKPGDLPDDVYVVDAAPLDWLFPQMAAVVHHGGAGTTAAGLAAGRPTVVVPFFADQHFWAWRVTELGAGPRPIPRRRMSAERLAAAITEATGDSSILARAALLGQQIRKEDGIGEVVNLLPSV
jgi:sterol 3beta-glucosyltransferase